MVTSPSLCYVFTRLRLWVSLLIRTPATGWRARPKSKIILSQGLYADDICKTLFPNKVTYPGARCT